jgi:hypothetical protein
MAKDIKIKMETTTTRTFRASLGRDALVRALRSVGIVVPKNGQIFVAVPGGGDWSNTSLHIGLDVPLEVQWSHTEETEDDGII